MSYCFDLCDPVTRECLSTNEKHYMFGSNVCIGGTTAMTLDITYNYSSIINKVTDCEDGYADYINGKTGAETISFLKATIEKLANDVDDDYWRPTEGNAKRALSQLLALAQMRPDGVWMVY